MALLASSWLDPTTPRLNAGFKLLELIGLELDLPVIMMSASGETHYVMRGVVHGACDYLVKPVRMEELKNIWQHVLRRRKASGSHQRRAPESRRETPSPFGM